MQERTRPRVRPELPGPGGGPFDDAGAPGTATVAHGPYAEQLPVAEMTVAEIRSRFRDRLDIHPHAMALLDGSEVNDATRVRAGQMLSFVRPAGEKGQLILKIGRSRPRPVKAATVTIEGEEARAALPEGSAATMKLVELFERLELSRPDFSKLVLADGVKCLLPRPKGCILVHQTPPRVYSFNWIAADSPAPYGPETSYRRVRIALPYVIVLAVFERARGDLPRLGQRNECFFLDRPLETDGFDSELCYPALLNCSRFPDAPEHPLAWICTAQLRPPANPDATLEQSLREGLRALLHHLFETGFNRSSEQHEGSSWFSETVAAGIDPRVASIEAWEQATAADPLFVLDVPWLKTGRSLRAVTERIFVGRGAAASRVASADDLARVMFQAQTQCASAR